MRFFVQTNRILEFVAELRTRKAVQL